MEGGIGTLAPPPISNSLRAAYFATTEQGCTRAKYFRTTATARLLDR